MGKAKPIKRHKSLQPLSREHHFGLLLCWKIKIGFQKGIEIERIKRYADWFFEMHIQPHFKAEEEYIFPILGVDNDLIKKAIADHQRLFQLFNNNKEIKKSLSLIEKELEAHIRFEERVLFNEIQNSATNQQLELINRMHEEHRFMENTEDEFWS